MKIFKLFFRPNNRFMIEKKQSQKGIILVNVIVFAAIVIIVTIALVNWGALILKTTRNMALREQAFQIAEGGIDYYRWHLAHAQSDYWDGTGGQPGPYIHQFKDSSGNVIGQYELTITPPPSGSSIVKIKSVGRLQSNPNITRTIQATLAIPSFAKYSVVANAFIRFGENTDVYGPIHSNNGIRFDGRAHNLITSAVDKFNDTENPGGKVFGVYTTINPEDPRPPASVPDRPDVFMAGREFPVPVVDFDGLTFDLSNLKSLAQSNGRYIAPSGVQGYHIVLKTNDTFDLYKVTALQPEASKCDNNLNQGGWGTWSIKTQQFVANYSFPANGIVFVEDHFWIDGQINTARLTLAAGRFPEAPGQYRNIIINTNLLYTNYDGSDVISLVAQGDIDIGLMSDNVLRIDAALVAQNGRVGRHYYSDHCGTDFIRDQLTLYGMIVTNGRYGFAYTDGTGYEHRNIIYDSNLLFMPPPSFPLTSDQYQTISWQEVK